MTSRTYRMAADETQAALDAMAAELAAAIAVQQAAELEAEQAAGLAARFSAAGVQAADIHLTPTATSARRMTREELTIAATRGTLAALEEDLTAALETGAPVTTPAPVAPVQAQGFWAGVRAGYRANKAYSVAYANALR